MNFEILVSVGSAFPYWELHEGRKEEIILFPPILQENIIEVRNERSFFGLKVFAVHLCNNQKQRFGGRVWILVSAESGRERVVLLVLCSPLLRW